MGATVGRISHGSADIPKAKHLEVKLEPRQEPEDAGEPAHGQDGSIDIGHV